MSIHAYAYAANDYLILDSGGALGHRNGPLLISKSRSLPENLEKVRIAIPGRFTTANLLFSIAWPGANNKKEYLFSEIEEAILKDEVNAGLIIHETRFTYAGKGLYKIADMGEYWEDLTGLAIPLGIIAVNRRIPQETALKVNRIIKRSLEYAYEDSLASYDFVSSNAREMDTEVMNKHIKLYVNKFSLNLGKEGKGAINEMFRLACERKVIPALPDRIFLSGK
jgi:1,4-dihydroxy-6-naphthoate synthase